MNSQFIPLLAPEAALAPMPQFQPVLPAIAAAATTAAAATKAAPHVAHHPVVSLVRNADHVTHIRISCACGQLIELACEYQG